ncbi:MAG: hypothetical protein ACRD0L_10655 [Acidimicrobiales bacterium]
MGAVVGFVLGYVLGTRAGPRGFEELQASWTTISSSDEMKDVVSGGLSVLRDLLRQGRGLLAERLQEEPRQGLRPVA